MGLLIIGIVFIRLCFWLINNCKLTVLMILFIFVIGIIAVVSMIWGIIGIPSKDYRILESTKIYKFSTKIFEDEGYTNYIYITKDNVIHYNIKENGIKLDSIVLPEYKFENNIEINENLEPCIMLVEYHKKSNFWSFNLGGEGEYIFLIPDEKYITKK